MKQTRVAFLPLLTLAILLVGCSSLRKQADEQFEKGAYEEALTLYGQALQENPADADASAGQRRTREKLIDKRLLTVRHTRLGGNAPEALRLLVQVVTDENEWKVFPGGAVSSTQEEETSALFPYFRGQVDTALRKKQPLRMRYLVEHHRAVFAGQHQSMLDSMVARSTVDGKASCAKLSEFADASVPYYAQYLAKYCGLFGVNNAALLQLSRSKWNDLYKNVAVGVAIRGTDDATDELFAKAAEEAFQQSPWFDASGAKQLQIHLAGSFTRRYSSRPETRSHAYSVSIPYTSYEMQTKTRYVQRRRVEPQCFWDVEQGRQVCNDVPRYYNEPETYSESVPVTRYRSEPRVQYYDGEVESQTLTMTVSGRLRLATTERKVSISDRSHTSGFSHEWNMPSIGLTRQSAGLTDPTLWQSEQATALGGAVARQSDEAWDALYCRPLAQGAGMAAQANQVHRCLRRRPELTPAFVTAWYTTETGITPDEAATLFSLSDF